MSIWQEAARAALVSGSSASLASAVALACSGERDCASAFAPVNAVSHWVWSEKAIPQQGPSLRYTLPGYLIHHAMSVLWALLYEHHIRADPSRRPAGAVASGLVVAGVACAVDLEWTPHRLTPGFERRLPSGSLAAVYLAFGIGLALPGLWRALRS